MCGLVGLLLPFDPDARVDLAPLEAVGQALAGWEADAADAADVLGRTAAGLERLSRDLVGWPGFRTLRTDGAARDVVAGGAARLRNAAEAIDARLDDARVASSAEGEVLARAAVAARDVAWRVEHDAIPNLERAARLAPADWPGGDKGWFELWRTNLILNQLERLEVRGRDSGGLATLVHLDARAWRGVELALGERVTDALEERRRIPSLRDGAVLRVDVPAARGGGVALAFAHKVAKEVGELGANVRELRQKLRADELWRGLVALPEARVQVMAHTRWASNGVISEPNCHPVANDLAGEHGALDNLPRIVLGVVNGDVDNYASLALDWAIPADCTTDAKVVPLEVHRRLAAGREPTDAVVEAAASFAGSTAIGVLASDDPDHVHLAQKGSGQAIYVGVLDGGGYLYASELYGVVELAARSYKLDGERGEVVRLGAGRGVSGIHRVDYAGAARPLANDDLKDVAIATRDIDRAGFPHYLLKEISEAPRSVERTLRGKFVLDGARAARFLLGPDVVPPAVRAGLTDKTIRRVLVIGQGTAAVAGRAAADYMTTLLAPAGVEVRGLPATELSGYQLDTLGSDCLVVAVSQSGTTTDTNRTVDLARQRGAHVIGIVNRRGSDLADKSDGVLYTSDGRDVEMSVASTKAFYCQVVAGFLLGLQLAELAGTIGEEELASRLLRLDDLPRCLREVLGGRSRERIRQAALLAVRRRHWTVVGSGPLLPAAHEVRIKLSELCYKSVPVDTIEDKKHIDLSSEPLVLACAAGLSGPAAADAVKEIAIFRAHAAAPVVICDRGETRYAEYAEATIPVPASAPEVALLLNTLAGHLFSYETALAIDRSAGPLRRTRDVCEAAAASLRGGEPEAEVHKRFRVALAPVARDAFRAVAEGEWNAGLAATTACRLVNALHVGLGHVPAAVLGGRSRAPSFREDLELLLAEVSHAVDALRRPIDAIKHQAKTVTVGISRAEVARPEPGAIERAFTAAGTPPAALSDADAAALTGLEPAVAEVLGVVRYELSDLDPLGAPTDRSRITVAQKTGVAAGMSSRAEAGTALRGTKRLIVRDPRVWVGRGQRDGSSLVACPLYGDGIVSGLALAHVRFEDALTPRQRARALRSAGRYEDLKCLVHEQDAAWSDALLTAVPTAELLTTSVEPLGRRLAEAAAERARAEAAKAEAHSDTAALVSPFLDGPAGAEPGGPGDMETP